MSPNLIGKLGPDSLYLKIKNQYSQELADKIWNIWKNGRNQIFHYFPHNTKAINFSESRGICLNIIRTMEEVYEKLNNHSDDKLYQIDQKILDKAERLD
jgi:type I restriction-modification system DNA methylase subunit